METDDIRVPPVSHCPVEVIPEHRTPQQVQIGVRWRFVIEEDEMLVRESPSGRRQVVVPQVASVEDDGVAFVD